MAFSSMKIQDLSLSSISLSKAAEISPALVSAVCSALGDIFVKVWFPSLCWYGDCNTPGCGYLGKESGGEHLMPFEVIADYLFSVGYF